MHIGVPKEIKPQEARVGLTPAGVRELTDHDHEVDVERGAGRGARGSRMRPIARRARGSSRRPMQCSRTPR